MSDANFNSLPSGISTTRPVRSAFTVVELVVSVGILGIMLVMAGSIFTLTLKSSGEANAIIEVSQAVRAFEDTLREDLQYAQPSQTILVIQGNPIVAYWDIDELEADNDGDPTTPITRDPTREFVVNPVTGELRHENPRADVLMFFTTKPGKSFRDPSITGRLQQVVYGHAEMGIWDGVLGSWVPNTLTHFPTMGAFDSMDLNDPGPLPVAPFNSAQFPPARQWHLARRSVLILDQSGPFVNAPPAISLDDSAAVLGSSDDDPSYSALGAANQVRDGRRDFVINTVVERLNSPNNPTEDFRYADYVLGMTPLDEDNLGREVALDPDNCCGAPNMYPNLPMNQFQDSVEQYRHWIVPWFARSQMDSNPPPLQAQRLGPYFFPNCASFKVEWALSSTDPATKECLELFDDTVWVDPSDIGATSQLLADKIVELNADPALADELAACGVADAPLDQLQVMFDDQFGRFSSQLMGSNHLFYAKDPASDLGDGQIDPMFPESLRVTIDVYDSSDRLERPIRHVMIIPIGG